MTRGYFACMYHTHSEAQYPTFDFYNLETGNQTIFYEQYLEAILRVCITHTLKFNLTFSALNVRSERHSSSAYVIKISMVFASLCAKLVFLKAM